MVGTNKGCIGFDREIFVRLVVPCVMILVGCSLNQQGDREVSMVLSRQEQSRPEQATFYAGISKNGKKDSAVKVTQPAGLRDFIMLALMENPDIKAAQSTALARAKRIPQVTALPDPMLATKTFTSNRPMMLADGNNVFVMSITQQLPNPEKLDRAGRVALEETRMALAELEQIRLRVIGDVKRVYFQRYIIGKTIQITRDNQALLRELIDVARIQMTAGKRSQDDVLRAQVESSNLDRDLIDLRQQQATATGMLNVLVNRRPDYPIAMPDEFEIPAANTRLEALLDRAVKSNPELQRLEHQIERDRQSRRLAQLGYWPEFNVGMEWMAMEPRRMPTDTSQTSSPNDMYAIMAEINLPIWVQKIDAGIKEAEYNLGASIDRYTSTKNMVYFRIQDALSRVQAQKELVDILKNTITPQAKQTYELSRTSYTAGTTDFLYLLDNWQKWQTFTIQYHRALGELERSIADLEQEIGMSLTQAGF
ncbi:MAG: TolC family protein [Phycisphaerae bacterium]